MTTTLSPEGFIEHHDEAFCQTWALFWQLTWANPIENDDVRACLTFAHTEYEDDGLRRPAPAAEVQHPTGLDAEDPVLYLDQLIRDQLEQATDLETVLRLRRTREYLAEGLEHL